MREKQLIAGLVAALEASEIYVQGAYECAFPNVMENESVAAMVEKAIADAKAYLDHTPQGETSHHHP